VLTTIKILPGRQNYTFLTGDYKMPALTIKITYVLADQDNSVAIPQFQVTVPA
jgi:hypothetical protein